MNDSQNRFQLFDSWFNSEFGTNPGGRLITWKVSLAMFLQHGGGLIVETGCQRQENDWGAGCSTFILGQFLKQFQAGHLCTVDIVPEHIDLAKQVSAKCGLDHLITFVVADSIAFLQAFEGTIDFLYLDSYDWFPNEPLLTECQQHQLHEMQACITKLSSKAIILLDDNNLPNGGKTRLTKTFLSEGGWKCLIDQQQSLWSRK